MTLGGVGFHIPILTCVRPDFISFYFLFTSLREREREGERGGEQHDV